MNLNSIVAELQRQRTQLQSQLHNLDVAIAAISGSKVRSLIRRRVGARHISAAARKRIAAAQRRRWAKWKRQQKKS